MEIHQDVLSASLYQECLAEFSGKFDSNVWGSNLLRWDESVTEGVIGEVLFTKLEGELKKKLFGEIGKHLNCNDISKFSSQFYIWKPNSSIPLHDDSIHKIAGTIYLNKAWHANFGGLFVWDPSGGKSPSKCYVPRCNSMVVNDQLSEHAVTMISPTAPEPRYTIQVWAEE